MKDIMYAVDLSQKSIQIAIKDKQGKLVKESKMDKNKDLLLEYLKDANAKSSWNLDIITSFHMIC